MIESQSLTISRSAMTVTLTLAVTKLLKGGYGTIIL